KDVACKRPQLPQDQRGERVTRRCRIGARHERSEEPRAARLTREGSQANRSGQDGGKEKEGWGSEILKLSPTQVSEVPGALLPGTVPAGAGLDAGLASCHADPCRCLARAGAPGHRLVGGPAPAAECLDASAAEPSAGPRPP